MSDEAEIRTIIESWAKAVAANDRKAVLARHSSNLLYVRLPGHQEGHRRLR